MILSYVQKLINEVNDANDTITKPRYIAAPSKFSSYVLSPVMGAIWNGARTGTALGAVSGALGGLAGGALTQYISKPKGYKSHIIKNIAIYDPD